MGLIKKEDVVTIKSLDYADISRVIDKFLDWKILPNFIFQSFYAEYSTNSDTPWLSYMYEHITNSIRRAPIELEFVATVVWNNFNRGQRYKVLLDMLTYNLKVDILEQVLKDIFKNEYHTFMADIILNYIDINWDFTFITKENDRNSN